jgi:hypothetical protein
MNPNWRDADTVLTAILFHSVITPRITRRLLGPCSTTRGRTRANISE